MPEDHPEPPPAAADASFPVHGRGLAELGAGDRIALTDTRGPYTLVLFTGNATTICLSGPSLNSLGSGGPDQATPVLANQIVVGRAAFTDRNNQPLTLIEGRTGTDVHAVSCSSTTTP